ncbi:putative fluoride ion transporter CrcB [compost metagenome]
MSLPAWIWIASGGAVGSVARFYMGAWVAARLAAASPGNPLAGPGGTLAVNLLGSFVLGAIATLALTKSTIVTPEMRLLLAVGFCGGFTTFSTFTYEAWTLLERGQFADALLYMGASNLLGLLAVVGGIYAARLLT